MSRRRRIRQFGTRPTVRLTEVDVRAQFDAGTFQRGDDYQLRGNVLDLSMDAGDDGLQLVATVRGSGRQVYDLVVDLTPSRSGTVCEGFCTCPVQMDCKHVVAALLAGVRDRHFVSAPQLPMGVEPTTRAEPPAKPADPLAGPVRAWLSQLSEVAGATGDGVTQVFVTGTKSPPPEALLYCFSVIRTPSGHEATSLELLATRPLKAGGWGAGRALRLDQITQSTGRYMAPVDRAIARVLVAEQPLHRSSDNWPAAATPDSLEWAMEKILATGRAHLGSKDGARLQRGPDRPGRLVWRLNGNGEQIPVLAAEQDGLVVLPSVSPWVVDPLTGACGRLLMKLPAEMVRAILNAPSVAPEQAQALADALTERFPSLSLALPRADVAIIVDNSLPVPVLRLASRKLLPVWAWERRASSEDEWIDGAWLRFDYGGEEIAPHTKPADLRRTSGHTVTVRKRRPDLEQQANARLAVLGLTLPANLTDPRIVTALAGGGMCFPLKRHPNQHARMLPEDPFAWPAFVHESANLLAGDGWRIVVEEGFRHNLVSAEGEWQAEIEDKGGWWFSLDLGIEVAGERIALLPVLVAAIARLKPDQPLDSLATAGMLYSRMPDGRTLALPFERVRALVAVLVELFGDRPAGAGTMIDLSLAQAMGLDAIAEATRLRWVGSQRLRDLATRLRAEGIGAQDRPVPAGFAATLRDYQRIGFGWMGFLADHGLGGVLADDMGLGKTVQALAHILAEKVSGRMQAPFLVVCPTSLVATWRDEAIRFAPDLNVLILHGTGRARDAAAFDGVDLVVTTYPLLPRDGVLLESIDWHGVALDEAQAIKNPASRWTQVACRLNAGHRFCLTGTPVENHLGEAWSLFAFLMPGLLGDAKSFTKLFRTPIEKRGDADRRQLLSRRLKPFLLRRTKAEVATELPPKTEMVRWIDLAGGQRDLYETLRLAMDQKVRQAVARKGLSRSAIEILDALLKLRQACCDPRLVKLKASGKGAPASAKLDFLMEFLPALVEEGRRILLFSQFTSMLDLIKPELAKADIPFVELTGQTTDRATPVKQFQSGAVPLFLISLKAGGVGLTLTAADTVIHYDPWWNPAVEDQATDRAHRIGQNKPVFVYKLIAAGTVEERMLELQSRKRAVAEALFDPDSKGALVFNEEDIAALFQPMA